MWCATVATRLTRPRSRPRRARASLLRNPRSLQAVGIAVSLVSLAAVVWWALRQDAPTLPDEPGRIAALVAAVGVYAVGTVLRGERWRALLHRSGVTASRADCQGLNLVGYMGNNVLPARAGDVLRVSLLVPRVEGGARTVIGTLAAERLLDAATLLGLFALLGYVLLDGVGAPSGARVAIVAGVALAAVAAAAAAFALARRHGRAERLRAFVAPMTAAVRELRGRHGAEMLAVTLAIWFFEAGTWFAVGVAADLGLDPIEALYLVALASVFVLIPSGPGYAGTLDAAVVFGVKAVGGSGAEAVSYLLLLRFVLLVPITLAGLAVLAARYGGWQRPRGAPIGSGA